MKTLDIDFTYSRSTSLKIKDELYVQLISDDDTVRLKARNEVAEMIDNIPSEDPELFTVDVLYEGEELFDLEY